MTINLQMPTDPDITELKPKITVFGVGGAGGNAVNNMINSGLEGVEFVVANTDAQALSSSVADRVIQMGLQVTEGLGAGSQPEIGNAAAEEVMDEIQQHLAGSHMAFITAGMGGGTGTGAAPVVARAAREQGILTVGVVTKPFQFEGARRMRLAEAGIEELQANVDTLIVIPNQNLFRIANEKTTFADAFSMADQVLYSGVACITDLMVKEGLINLDFADVRSVMREMGKAMMGTGEASGESRAIQAAEAAIANPLLDETSMRGAQGLLISITGGNDLTLFEVDEAATRIREEVDADANIILGATFDESLEGIVRVSVVATGIETEVIGGVERPASSAVRPIAAARPVAAVAPAASEKLEEELSVGNFSKGAAAPSAINTKKPTMPAPASSDPDVTIKPFSPLKTETFRSAKNTQNLPAVDQMDTPKVSAAATASAVPVDPYIPPQAETVQGTKMPRVEDFPVVAQNEIKAAKAKSQSGGAQTSDDERGALGLFRKITGVGLGGAAKRDDQDASLKQQTPAPAPHVSVEAEQVVQAYTEIEANSAAAAVPVNSAVRRATAQANATQPAPAPARVQAQPVPAPQAPVARAPAPSAPTAPVQAKPSYKAPAGQLDRGRQNVKPTSAGQEEELEIPAFLRRNSQ